MFFRKFFRRSENPITKEQAIQIAKVECKKRDWTWREPISATSQFGGNWKIRTNVGSRGVNARFVVDKFSGEVKSAVYINR